MSAADFWSNQEAAQQVVTELKALKSIVDPLDQLTSDINDAAELWELAQSEGDAGVQADIEAQLAELAGQLDRLELQKLLSGQYDQSNCYFSIQAGAGGTESCDWAEMLFRMYLRYFEKHGYDVEEISRKDGEEAGIQSMTLLVKKAYAYGYLSCEMGVHRLVRISPFDSQSRRHTSFASVDVVPDMGDCPEIEVEEEDLRIDYFRAGGAGGQHVNKVSSAVRITHLPTGIVVGCQNERSQHQNRRVAMSMLKAKLFRLEEQKRNDELARLVGDKGEIAWGNQIRSYVLQPYQLVKDHRTDHQTGDTQSVLDGDIQGFIDAYLQHRAKLRGM
jgi:peptide chain release factor 2